METTGTRSSTQSRKEDDFKHNNTKQETRYRRLQATTRWSLRCGCFVWIDLRARVKKTAPALHQLYAQQKLELRCTTYTWTADSFYPYKALYRPLSKTLLFLRVGIDSGIPQHGRMLHWNTGESGWSWVTLIDSVYHTKFTRIVEGRAFIQTWTNWKTC